MFREVLRDIYLVKVPLPRSPLKEINSYIIKGNGRNLVVDTGFDQQECLDVLVSAFEDLGINMGEIDYFITHRHADHLALVPRLARNTSRVYLNEADALFLASSASIIKDVVSFAIMQGIPESVLQTAVETVCDVPASLREYPPFVFPKEGDVLQVGRYTFVCLETPGHTVGSMCLYEPSRKLFISGDHILRRITPNVSLWDDEHNPLIDYMSSLRRTELLDINLTLPGHGELFYDCHLRVNELLEHHQKRLNEIVGVLTKGYKSAYEIARSMKWGSGHIPWDEFPSEKKLLAIGETLAHVKYLLEKERIRKERRNGSIVYRPVGK